MKGRSKMAKPNGNRKGGRPAPPPQEKVVKKKSGCLIPAIILLLLLLLAFLLGFHFGWWGKGSGDGDGKKGSGTSSSDSDSKKQKDIYVTVSGAKYIYENNTIEIEDFLNKAADIEGKPVVHITDDKATDSAMNELKNALTNSKISYVEEAEADSTAASTEK